MSDAYELMPCPFCGKTPKGADHTATRCRASEPHSGLYHGEVWHSCGIGTYARSSVYRSDRETALRDAAAAWNRRAEPRQGRFEL